MEENKSKLKITFLGTGANGGTPQVDCRCINCIGKTTRKRASILIEFQNKKYVVDCGPDFKQQLIENSLRLQDVDGIFLTHLHWDHCVGLFELTSGQKFNVPIFAGSKVRKSLLKNENFKFIFESGFAKIGSKINDLKVSFIEVDHDINFPTCMIKISVKNKIILYCPDISIITSEFIKEAKLADLIILDGTFLKRKTTTHVSIEDSLKKLKSLSNKVIFTHINHSENLGEISKFLIEKNSKSKVAFDGMILNF